jgi:hypothetical protein
MDKETTLVGLTGVFVLGRLPFQGASLFIFTDVNPAVDPPLLLRDLAHVRRPSGTLAPQSGRAPTLARAPKPNPQLNCEKVYRTLPAPNIKPTLDLLRLDCLKRNQAWVHRRQTLLIW